MAVRSVTITDFLDLAIECPVFDVRSPGEYAYAHIPGAFSLPIFTNDERAEIGTTYKQVGRRDAIKIGVRYFGTRMNECIAQVEEIVNRKYNAKQQVLIHCWRGGMRSQAMAWLMDLYGFDVAVLEGGYKSYRRLLLKHLKAPIDLLVLNGYTGSGKTEVLHEMKRHNARVIDLESLASHKGSAFGGFGMPESPSQEQFENLLYMAIRNYCRFKVDGSMVQDQPIWVEGESQRIGPVNIPVEFFHRMQQAPMVRMDIPFEQRLDFITQAYGRIPTEQLVNAIIRIQKKLGGQHAKKAIADLLEGNVREAFRILLAYYDKVYERAIIQHPNLLYHFECKQVDAKTNAAGLLQLMNTHQHG